MDLEDSYLTRGGYEKLVQQLDFLKTGKRREIAKEIEKARAFGDLSENAEYEAARDAQAYNEQKIAELEGKLAQARIIDNENIAIMEEINNALAEMQNIFPDTCECCNQPSISVLCEECQNDIIFQRLEEEDFLEYLEIVDSFNDSMYW